ncbi:hypothetical protein A2716_03350 [candidate division WWE3 bacterium RIFCSPHIGHO2_01_FULL_40_23]|uniref:Uncharacterized protein n=1 Tax=candidate division WWE3 bacterium RIFCSPLOWO2_01_FULL_41_18 TaxID=1802625 RepID=A0A1F4VCE7_UNCKA|nr:MAG: hypothetical protein A2716_03350 [candidate division WWE3 bacterium RIFCSPHIGHO2_01_FULL_40_23]OGC54916.1 MAG: hypothetical protein A3A78_02960 [candidate division WWE3 bacterium RIFCSPLOWO2_01_FULL_41_18]
MKIAINGQILFIDELKPTGPYAYTENLIKALSSIDHSNIYNIYIPEENLNNHSSVAFNDLTNQNPNFNLIKIKKVLSFTHFSVPLQLFKDRPNIFFTAIHTVPIVKPKKTFLVSMVHGLEYEYSPRFKNTLGKLAEILPLYLTSKLSDIIIVPSNYTKDKLIEKRWVNKQKMSVIPEGIKDIYGKSSPSEIEEVKKKFNLVEKPYLIFISTIQPRKNIPKMVEAFSQAYRDLGIKSLSLLIVGKKGWDYKEALEAPARFGIENQVIFKHDVSDNDLASLLPGSTAFINISLEEGFGLTVLEALRCKVPCILSDIPPFQELAAGAAYFNAPDDIKGTKENIINAITNTKLNLTLLNKGYEISKKYTWENTAKTTLRVFESLVKNI